ncbi:Clp protease/crotonase-like domain-containing protein [Duganella sp. PWIR1]
MSDLPVAIEALQSAHPGRDFLLFSAAITRDVFQQLSRLIEKEQHNTACTVFLTTRGGDPDAAYRIARTLQQRYQHIRIAVPSRCKSAGTLIVIGAHELAMGELGELGPIDIQVVKPAEFHERGSALDVMQAIEVAELHVRNVFLKTLRDLRRDARLSTKIAGQLATNIAMAVAAPLYNQIYANRLGELRRTMEISKEYGERLNNFSHSLREEALETLCTAYPSHGFVIDSKEARELFQDVLPLTVEESAICTILWDLLGEESGEAPAFIRPSGDCHG